MYLFKKLNLQRVLSQLCIVKRMSNSNKNIFNITNEVNWPYAVKKEVKG
jgi:hypothetical protein